MKKEQKVWIVFLTHLYYEIEERIDFCVASPNDTSLESINEFKKNFIKKLKSVWRDGVKNVNFKNSGDIFINLKHYRLLEFGSSYCSNISDVFRDIFGKDMFDTYYKLIYNCEVCLVYDLHSGGKLRFYRGDKTKNFQFQNDVIEPYVIADVGENLQEKIKKGFDKDFLVFFEKHIGMDFSKAENFFEVYLK